MMHALPSVLATTLTWMHLPTNSEESMFTGWWLTSQRCFRLDQVHTMACFMHYPRLILSFSNSWMHTSTQISSHLIIPSP